MIKCYTLEELKKYTNAFDGFKPVNECNIPDYYKIIFPSKCLCGAQMIMTEPEHTQLQCCNPSCYIKFGYRLAYFISSLGYKGFGEQSCLSIFNYSKNNLRFNSFLAAFLLSDTELSQSLSEHFLSVFKDIREDLSTRKFSFISAISSLGIPNIGPRSPFFDIVKSPVVLIQYSLKDKTNELCSMSGIQAPMTRFYLSEAKLDIVTLAKDIMPNIADTPKNEVYVAITGKVSVGGVTYSRYDFIELCESLLGENNEQLYKIIETKAESKIQYVIADEKSNSEKYRLGAKLGKLITADEFYNLLKSRIQSK